MPYITVKDGTEIYYKVWGPATGQTFVFSHGWPLNADNWDSQMFYLAGQGYRCIAHDRRGHGRSSQPWDGNNLDTFADDLYAVFTHLDLKDVCLVGHSTGGGEVTKLIARHGSSRIRKAVLISSMTPFMLKTDDNPIGLPMSVFDGFKSAMVKDRAKLFLDVPTGPFFGYNREGATVSQGQIWSWWQQGMMCGLKSVYETVTVWTEGDQREELKKINIPVLVIHGTDDQIVPFNIGGPEAVKYLKHGKLKVYEGGAHALPNLNADEINQDLVQFFEE